MRSAVSLLKAKPRVSPGLSGKTVKPSTAAVPLSGSSPVQQHKLSTQSMGFAQSQVQDSLLQELYAKKVDVEGLSKDLSQELCLKRLGSLLQDLAAKKPSTRGVYIHGSVGAGKTMMLDMFHGALLEQGITSRRVHFHDMVLDIHQRLHHIRVADRSAPDSPTKALHPMVRVVKTFLKETQVLCFDEVHVLNVGDAMLMRGFFEQLLSAGGVVVATSNLAPGALYASGINRDAFMPFVSKLLEHCDLVQVKGAVDYRAAKVASAEQAALSGKTAPNYFFPSGSEADAKLASSISRVRGEDAAPERIEVPVMMGRSMQCRAAWLHGVRIGKFSFDELCGHPVGAPDFLGLCNYFDALAITDIPLFTESCEDEARRFVTLVDLLYDKGKGLLCTAEAAPENIFDGLKSKYQMDETAGSEAGQGHSLLDDEVASDAPGTIRVPTWGGSSGRIVTAYRDPNAIGARAGDKDALESLGGESPEQGAAGWVEWSATGLKGATMWDLTGKTNKQKHDRLLPLLRCTSRIREMSVCWRPSAHNKQPDIQTSSGLSAGAKVQASMTL